MPTYLEIMPEDVLAHIYRMLYKLVIDDMKKDTKYKNIECLNRLNDISSNPYVDKLFYYDFVIKYSIDKVVKKYNRYKIEYYEDHFNNYLLYNTPLYYKSYYTKPLEMDINKIEIYNFFVNNLYKGDSESRIDLFNDTYFATRYYTGIVRGINKNGFIMEKEGSFRCMAELFYYAIDFYDCIKQILYMNISMIEQMGDIMDLSAAKLRERDDLIYMLNYHINHNYIEGLFYEIKNKCAIIYLD